MFNWIKQFWKLDYGVTTFSIGTEANEIIMAILTQSSHTRATDVLSEAIGVVEAIYDEATKGQTVTCGVENGRIVLYVTDPDDGDTHESPLRTSNVIRLHPRAA